MGTKNNSPICRLNQLSCLSLPPLHSIVMVARHIATLNFQLKRFLKLTDSHWNRSKFFSSPRIPTLTKLQSHELLHLKLHITEAVKNKIYLCHFFHSSGLVIFNWKKNRSFLPISTQFHCSWGEENIPYNDAISTHTFLNNSYYMTWRKEVATSWSCGS